MWLYVGLYLDGVKVCEAAALLLLHSDPATLTVAAI